MKIETRIEKYESPITGAVTEWSLLCITPSRGGCERLLTTWDREPSADDVERAIRTAERAMYIYWESMTMPPFSASIYGPETKPNSFGVMPKWAREGDGEPSR